MTTDNKRSTILEGNLTMALAGLTLPIFISDLIQRGYAIVDLFFLGKLGAIPLASITYLEPLQTGIIAIAGGMCMAATSIIARSVGGGRYHRARMNLGNLLMISFVFSLMIGFMGMFFTRNILELIKTREEIFEACYSYLRPILMGAPFTFLNMLYVAVRQAEGDTKKPLILSGFSLGLNALLNPIFIFHMNLGITGAAITTVLSRAFLGGYIVYDLLTSKKRLKLERAHFRVKRSIVRTIVSIASPATMSRVVYSVGKMILYTYCIKYGAVAMAVFGSGIMIQDSVFLIIRSIGAANIVVAGQNLGNKNYGRVRDGLKRSALAALILGVTGVTLLIIFPREIGGLVIKEVEILERITFFFRTTSYTHILFGLCGIYEGFFIASGDSKFIMKMNMLKFWILRIGLLLILDTFTNLGEYSVWIALSLSNSTILPLYIHKYRKIMRDIAGKDIFERKDSERAGLEFN